jgi:hypothetical protein
MPLDITFSVRQKPRKRGDGRQDGEYHAESPGHGIEQIANPKSGTADAKQRSHRGNQYQPFLRQRDTRSAISKAP